MSSYSGKCDLADHIFGSGGFYDRDGNPVKFGQEGVGAYYADEYRDFLAFKEATGGVIHQHKKIKVTPWNHEDVAKLCPQFKAIPHCRIVPDKRQKSGKREEQYYTYKYWGTEYKNEKELNKRGVYIELDIHFDTMLDLIPYYPYIVSCACGKDGKSYVCVSSQSYVDEELEDHLDSGWYSDFWQHYKKDLQDHYRQVVLRYFNPEGREHVEEITFDENGIGKVSKPIDENFDLEWRWPDDKMRSHWTSPKIKNAKEGLVEMSKQDLEGYIGNKALVYYVEAKEYPVILW